MVRTTEEERGAENPSHATSSIRAIGVASASVNDQAKTNHLARGLLAATLLSIACGGSREIVLHELSNDGKVESTPVGVSAIVDKKEWRSGKRVTVTYATLLVHTSKAIQKQEVATGDVVLIGPKKWQVVAVKPGGADTRGVVVLEEAEED
jgi:hypothetical protein